MPHMWLCCLYTLVSLAQHDHPQHVDHAVSPCFAVVLLGRLQSVPEGGDRVWAAGAWEFLMGRNAGVLVV